jgi:hypothetical protein
MAPANIFNGHVLIRLSNTLVLFAIIDVPGWCNNSLQSRNSVNTTHPQTYLLVLPRHVQHCFPGHTYSSLSHINFLLDV